jgi:hypothetical protein
MTDKEPERESSSSKKEKQVLGRDEAVAAGETRTPEDAGEHEHGGERAGFPIVGIRASAGGSMLSKGSSMRWASIAGWHFYWFLNLIPNTMV